MEKKNVLWFKEVGIKDVPVVGGKNASLGEMITHLVPKGINIPNGFATTADAYFYFLEKTGIKAKIAEILGVVDPLNMKELQKKGKAVRDLIKTVELPEDLKAEIVGKYKELSAEYNTKNVDVAVRSSATAEDLPNASFAGQQETFLNVKGEKELIDAVRKCMASLFTDRAIAYRQELGFNHLKVGLSVGVQKMVRSDVGASGVMFSCDTESGFGEVVLINASYGLGENVVLGKVDPDQYYVYETTLKKGFRPILEKRLGSKLVKMIYAVGGKGKRPVKDVPVSPKDRSSYVLDDDEILTLAKWATVVEDHYNRSMDMEWAKDGKDGKLYIVQARPETVQSRKNINVLEEFVIDKSKAGKVLVTGMSVGNKIGQGKVNRIMSAKEIGKFKKGEVLVTDMTDPDWVPAMKLASAIVTDRGGRTCHAAIVGRELGVPTIVGTGNGTHAIKSGKAITVSCAEGETGKVYDGIVPFSIKKTDISKIEKTKVKITMNLGEPSRAFTYSFIPNDGVGLAREEFIIANDIKVHPLALLNYKKLQPALKKKIDIVTSGYKDKTQFYVDKLAEGISKIGAAFYPKQVIVRFSDFKTNEYRTLLGGSIYEPEEENPMIGWRGASRYYDPKFAEAFILECKAMKKVREEFGLDNVQVMIPFCRTIDEGTKVLDIMKGAGLGRGEKGLKVYVMCEIPSNVILAEEFLEIFDGFSIGSNDLTQLTLGLDRDNGTLGHIGNEKNEAVKELLRKVIKICKDKKKYIGICGDGPSTFPDFAEFLVKEGIESLSLSPDAVIKTRIMIAEKEKGLLAPTSSADKRIGSGGHDDLSTEIKTDDLLIPPQN